MQDVLGGTKNPEHADHIAKTIVLPLVAEYLMAVGIERDEVAEPQDDDGMKWWEVRNIMLAMRIKGESFTSQQRLAKDIGCSPATVNKAIQRTASLQEWSERQKGSATGMQRLDGINADSLPQVCEPDGTDIIEDADVDKAMEYLLAEVTPEEKAGIRAMSAVQRRELAQAAYNDPDTAEQIFRYRRDNRMRRPTLE
jgi:hypothetical protein